MRPLTKSITPSISPADESRHTPAAPDPPSTAYTSASSTAAHAQASPGSPAGPLLPRAYASQRMPQRMWMHIRREPPGLRDRLHNSPDAPRRQSAVPPHPQVRHQRSRVNHSTFTRRPKLRLPYRKKHPHRLRRLTAQRHIPFLLALTLHQNGFIRPLNIRHVDPHQLRVPYTAPIQQLEDDPIPLRPRRNLFLIDISRLPQPRRTCGPLPLLERVQHPIHFLRTRHSGQMLRQLRSRHKQRRILLHVPFLRQPLEPAPHSRQRPRPHSP